jgi:hypothetical protein
MIPLWLLHLDKREEKEKDNQLDYACLQSALLRQFTVWLAKRCFTDEEITLFCLTKKALNAQSTAESHSQKSEYDGPSRCAFIRLPWSVSLLLPFL